MAFGGTSDGESESGKDMDKEKMQEYSCYEESVKFVDSLNLGGMVKLYVSRYGFVNRDVRF